MSSSSDDDKEDPQTPGGDAKADGENSGDAAKATSPSTPLSPREAESDGGNEADEPSSPKLGADNSLSATGGTGEGDEGGGGGGKTGLSDDSDDEPAPTKLEGAATKKKVVDSDEEEEEARQDKDDGGKKAEEINAPAGKTGLSSDSESGDDSAPKKKSGEGGDGDTEMAEATHKDVFGESDSDDDAGGNNKHKGQKVTLNKETGQLERGEVEDAPDHALQDSQVGRDKRVVSKETLKVSMPALPRPPTGARLVYVNPPKRHLMLDHAPFGTVEEETKKIAAGASDRYYQSASSIRWRYKEQGDEGEPWEKRNKETNARFVEWSDGSLTLNIGEEVFQVKKEDLAKNAHHLYAKHSDAKTLAEDGEDENSSILPIIEGHGVMESRMVIKHTQRKAGKKILELVSKQYGKMVEKDSMFIRKMVDDRSLSAQEAARIRDQSKREGARRRAGQGGEMNEDFLENDIDGDVGGYLAKSKRQRRQPNAAALQRAKARKKDSESSDSSSDSSDEAPRQAKRAAPSSSSSSSSDDDEGAAPVAKRPAPSAKKAAIQDSSSDSE
eukprot:CAMPEP_0179421594 /NCGR_PEP_ID=MMETSP0799-20121207/9877_1 /TAXON_ID=46947 /ORGANISM="Geminigera cryophila, Strain CCMP2564" /LENGTH=555 /DNA_ID=CAMNT_0021195467 /DNA_START=6 /DNA_END=1673 /DNA_ORIENTATION=+